MMTKSDFKYLKLSIDYCQYDILRKPGIMVPIVGTHIKWFNRKALELLSVPNHFPVNETLTESESRDRAKLLLGGAKRCELYGSNEVAPDYVGYGWYLYISVTPRYPGNGPTPEEVREIAEREFMPAIRKAFEEWQELKPSYTSHRMHKRPHSLIDCIDLSGAFFRKEKEKEKEKEFGD